MAGAISFRDAKAHFCLASRHERSQPVFHPEDPGPCVDRDHDANLRTPAAGPAGTRGERVRLLIIRARVMRLCGILVAFVFGK